MLSLNLIVFTCFFLLYTDEVFGKTDYCKFSPEHMLCGGGGFHPRCGKKGTYIYTDITESEIKDALDTHNNLRNEIALGRVTGGGGKSYPKASNMEELKWDGELAKIAAGTVKKCLFEHHCRGSSKCFRTERHSSIGENIYAKSSKNLESMIKDTPFANAIQSWFINEKDKYDPAEVPKYRTGKNSMGKGYQNHGHFTQVIWWGTKRIGCAKIAFKMKLIISCHYAPAGNVVGSTVYEKGEPCTKCQGQGRTCSKKYRGLCAAAGRPNDTDPDPLNVQN